MPVRIALRITALAPTPSTSSSARPAPPERARSAWRTRGRLAALSALLAVTRRGAAHPLGARRRAARGPRSGTSWAGRPRRTRLVHFAERRDGHARRRRRPGRHARARRRRAGADRRRRERPVGDRRRDRARHSGRGAASGAAQRGRRRGRAGDLRAARRGRRRQRRRARGRRAVGGEHLRSPGLRARAPAARRASSTPAKGRSRWPPTSAASSRSTRRPGRSRSSTRAGASSPARSVSAARRWTSRWSATPPGSADAAGARLVRVDLGSLRVTHTLAIGRRPVALAAAGEDLYVLVAGDRELRQGLRRRGAVATRAAGGADGARGRRPPRVGRRRPAAAVRALMRRFCSRPRCA